MPFVRSVANLCRTALCLLAAVPCLAAIVATAARAQLPDARVAVQRHGLALDAAALAAIDRGDAIARLQPTADDRDVTVIGVVRIAAARQTYMASVDDFGAWLRTPTRTRLGVFGDPPALATLRDLQMDPDEARDLRTCRPGRCTTKLAAAAMDHARTGIDWSARDVASQASAQTRQRLLQLVLDYAARGNAALPVYDDKVPVRSAAAFESLLAQSVRLARSASALGNYLRTFPAGRQPAARDVMHWSEDSGTRFRPVLSLSHSVVWTLPGPEAAGLVVTKQLYANHYFEAALEVVSVSDRAVANDAAASYLVIERRFRFDAEPRLGIFSMRGRTAEGFRDRLQADLRRIQRTWAMSASR